MDVRDYVDDARRHARRDCAAVAATLICHAEKRALDPPPIRRTGIPADPPRTFLVLQNLDRPAIGTDAPRRERRRAARDEERQQEHRAAHVSAAAEYRRYPARAARK